MESQPAATSTLPTVNDETKQHEISLKMAIIDREQ